MRGNRKRGLGGGVRGEDKLEDSRSERGEKKRKSNDLHMVSCYSLNIVTIDTCYGVLGLISRTQL